MRLRLLTNLVGIPLIIVFIIGAIIEISPDREEQEAQRMELPPLVSERAYAVSAAHPAAVQAGMDVMARGGNAVDAAIAVSFMLGVVEPYGSGIGGGGSMLIYDPTVAAEERIRYVDYRETAPRQLVTTSMIENNATGALQSEQGINNEEIDPSRNERDINEEQLGDFGVPGFLKGMAHLHEKYGTLPIKELVQPSVEVAEEGFTVDAYLADRFFYAQNRIHHADVPHFFPENDFIHEGQTLVQTELAETLGEIGSIGPERFFHEVLAPDMAERYPLMNAEDFHDYTVWEEESLPQGEFQGYHVYAAPPPLGGPVLIQSLYMAEKMGLDAYQFAAESADTAFYTGWEMEDVSSYADFVVDVVGINDRTYRQRLADIGDPNTSSRAREKMAEMYTREYASRMVTDWYRELENIQDDLRPHTEEGDGGLEEGTEVFRQQETDGIILPAISGKNEERIATQPFYDARSELHEHNNTTHFVVIDKDGRMVSATHTLSNFFGSGGYYKGFFLNDQLSNFSQTPGSINEPLPGRRPRSFMTPAILINETDGHVNEVIGIGSPGGARIPMMMAQALIYFGLHGLPFDDAVEMLRFQYEFNEEAQQFEILLEPDYQEIEMFPFLKQALNDRGFRAQIEHGNMYFGGIQALIHNVREGIIDGNADPRRGGVWDRAEYHEEEMAE
ncbi:gamma-glutamyltranspeptidase / glutathione hydrolase [Evansella caseinilytica]|uniref:Gamma-glutamyltranspeptidase / glutathione hydrolase n=1 Tax=Evansella caseinilytica TaxID=1503961 RepID=A0A1H3T968_9BACI|nr:gamma-glutamyltranspeptidase / glutathione hydrolase [Evansella caseinilytica]